MSYHKKQKINVILTGQFLSKLEALQKFSKEVRELEWKEYCYYKDQQAQKFEKIKKSLLSVAKKNSFNNHVRIVAYKYSNQPLSSKGSRLDPIGGRFNFGTIDSIKFDPFSCLYIASDKKTALAEKFSTAKKKFEKLKPEELLGVKGSYSVTIIKGQIDLVLDIRDRKNLKPFLSVIKKIHPPEHLNQIAKALSLPLSKNIQTVSGLKSVLNAKDWKKSPTLFNIPSPSQIFGHLVYRSGIQAILYNSQYTDKPCLAVFPENFEDRGGVIQLQDEVPANTIAKLSKKTWRELF